MDSYLEVSGSTLTLTLQVFASLVVKSNKERKEGRKKERHKQRKKERKKERIDKKQRQK